MAMTGRTAPEWTRKLTFGAPFLFNFPLRADLYHSLALTGARGLHYYANRLKGYKFNIKMLRQKAIIPRDEILESAIKILSNTSLMKFGIIEFGYVDEVGTGLGPTLEFYTLVSKEIRKLPIWRSSDDFGLFPAPFNSNQEGVLDYFNFIGKFAAKALQD